MTTNHHHNSTASNLDDLNLDFKPNGTMGELVDAIAEDDDAGPHYRRARWIAQTIAMLRGVRHDQGLSQHDIAAALGTKQPAIARLERSEDITLGRIWDYLDACDMEPLPLDIADRPSSGSVAASPEKEDLPTRHHNGHNPVERSRRSM